MVLLLPPGTPKRPSFGQRLNEGIGRGINVGKELYSKHQEKQALKELGIPENLSPELQKIAVAEKLRSAEAPGRYKAKYGAQLEAMKELGLDLGLDEKSEEPISEKSSLFAEEPSKIESGQAKKAKLIPENKIQGMALINPAVADKMQKHNDNILQKERHEDTLKEKRLGREQRETLAQEKAVETRNQDMRRETLPFRTELANKSRAAEKGIENKQHLLNIIKSGNINDPTYATIAESLPLNLGMRMLSPETVQYKAGLVDEFTDLRNIFQGQTRIKEIDILEAKIADIYLTDEQKESVLKSRMKALRADIIRAEAAEEVEKEKPYIGVLEFQREVDKKAKPKMQALFNNILDEQKEIISNAERRKNDLPLDSNDPDDRQILMQILQEAQGDKVEARRIAKKRGYKF